MVLFHFLTPNERLRWSDVDRFILHPLPCTKAELARHPAASTDPLSVPSGIPHWGHMLDLGEGWQGCVGMPCQDQLQP